MIECVMAWLLLIIGIIKRDGELLIASGAFAIACELWAHRKKIGVR